MTALKPCLIVTGAKGGIGQAVLQDLLDHRDFASCHIFALDWAQPCQGQATLQDTRLEYWDIDISDIEAISSCTHHIQDKYFIVGLVHAAGVLAHGPAVDAPVATIDHMLDVNVRGTVAICSAVSRIMLHQDASSHPDYSRSIITVASNAANGPRANMALYGASKAFASHYTRSLGLEMSSSGIRANVVSPGSTHTSMLESMWEGKDLRDKTISGDLASFRLGIPLQRIAEPQDIAPIISFLMTKAARHITLQEITVDGGATLR